MKDCTLEKDYRAWASRYNIVGSVVVETDKNDVTGIATQGKSSLENNTPTTPDAIYRIASISKVVTAIRIMQLVEEGTLSLDEDIGNYLGFPVRNPFFPEVPITLRHLMTQTSSLEDVGSAGRGYEGIDGIFQAIPLASLLTPGSERYAEGTYSHHRPGENWSYANLGCGILASIIEHVTAERFVESIKAHLLTPMGIESGFKLQDLVHPERLASHYTFDGKDFHLYRDYAAFKANQDPFYPLGENYRGVAGGLYISAPDLSKIMRMLMNGGRYDGKRYLKEETVHEMERVQWSGVPSDPTYRKKGLQMIILEGFTKKEPLWGHFGNAYGLRSFMLYTHQEGFIFLSNGANFLSDENHMTRLQSELISFLVGRSPLTL